MYLFFDTETTGLPDNWDAPLTDVHNWPRVVQLAWALVDDTNKTVKEKSVLIKPEGYIIPTNLPHRITQTEAIQKGESLEAAITEFIADVKQAKTLVAHNFDFDHSVVGCEIVRLRSREGTDFLNRPFDWYCTMKDSRVKNFCKLPPIRYGKGVGQVADHLGYLCKMSF